MKKNTPLGRLRIFPIIIIEIFAFVAIPFTTGTYLVEKDHMEWHERSRANAGAKVLYMTINTYMTKMEVNSGEASTENVSGAFTGSLKREGAWDNALNASFDGSSEDIDYFLKAMMGSDSYKAGCYYVYIKKGVPVQTYWSEHESLIKYADKLTRDIESDIHSENAYIGGYVLGGYPTEVREYDAPTPPYTETEKRLNAVYSAKRRFMKSMEYYITVWSPLIVILIIYILISRFTYFGRKLLRKERSGKSEECP